METFVTLKATAAVMLMLALSVHFSDVAFAQEQCTRCNGTPSIPCSPTLGLPPAKGGPPCLCHAAYPAAGCVLSQCGDQALAEFCDSSAGYGSVAGRIRAFSQKCSGRDSQCECCESYPDDCIAGATPPEAGGDPCTCNGFSIKPAGCILRPCRSNSDMYCICNEDFPNVGICFSSPCPGNADATVVDVCVVEKPKPGGGGHGGGGNNSGSSESSVIVSFHVLFAGVAVIFMRMA